MGWASGSSLAAELWDELSQLIPERHHRKAATVIWEQFERHDCDTLCECEALCVAAGRDWTNVDCLDETECGKWGCQDEAIGEGVHPLIGSERYPYETYACEAHKGELRGFKPH